jgi:hypothetical protein
MKKYNSIIKGFTKTIKKLEDLAGKNATKASFKADTISTLNSEIVALDAEGAMAATTARKLSELIGG